jgi:hypothetical protein
VNSGRLARTGVVTLAIFITLLGSSTGTATADGLFVGQTYEKASATLTEKGLTPVISSVVGDQLPTDQCIVTSSRKPTYAVTDNFDHGKEYMLAINCSALVAHGGQPGNSAASPQGRKERAAEKKAARYNAKPELCTSNLEGCKYFCDQNVGKCSDEILALF